MDSYRYIYEEERDLSNYHVICKLGVDLPDPVPKTGFTCDKYENKLATMPRIKRSSCAIEIQQVKK